MRWIGIAIVLLYSLARPACAHKMSDSYLVIEVQESATKGRWDIALQDLEYALGLDADGDLAITWGELKAKRAALIRYADEHLRVSAGMVSQPVTFGDLQVARRSDGAYASLAFSLPPLSPGEALRIGYGLLFDLDQQHRGLLRLTFQGKTHTEVFSPENRQATIDLQGTGSSGFWLFVKEGIWHIWKGIDHVLFLFALLLPAVLVRKEGRWEAHPDLREASVQVVKMITAFTVAHSITLSLATLGVLTFPPRIIEPIIAGSVVFAALNNVFGWVKEKLWWFAFGFGLVHGFGFAFVLHDLGLRQGELFSSLLGFNLGVELGQLAIVALVLPLAYAGRCTAFYRRYILQFGSAAIAVVAATWMMERVLAFKVLPF